MDKLTYSNPRLNAVIENWPLGFRQRVTATFSIEKDPKRGERAVRVIGSYAPKKLTFAAHTRIMDGSDGKTYLVRDTGGHFSVMQGNMKFSQEAIFPDDNRYGTLLTQFRESQS